MTTAQWWLLAVVALLVALVVAVVQSLDPDDEGDVL